MATKSKTKLADEAVQVADATTAPVPKIAPAPAKPRLRTSSSGTFQISRRAFVVWGGQFAAIVCIGLYGLAAELQRSSELFVTLGTIVLMGLFAWSVFSWRYVTRQLFHPYILFLLSALLFHGGQLILAVFGLNPDGMIMQYRSDSLVPAIFLTLIGLWGFHAGALAVAMRVSGRRNAVKAEVPERDLRALRMVGLILVGVAAFPFFSVMGGSIALRSAASYIAIYQQEAAAGLDNWKTVLSYFLAPGAMFLMVGAARRRTLLAISLASVFAVAVAWFLIGARSHAVMPIISAAWLWHTRVSRLPTWSLLAASVFFLGFVFPVFAVVRGNPLGEQMSLSTIYDAFLSIENPLVAGVSEMGISFRTVVDTLELVPQTRSHSYGIGYLHALLNVFPNFIPFLHFPLEYGTPDIWFVHEVDPYFANLGGAWGYSFIAEAYLEFGWLGAPIALGVLGAFIGWFSCWGANSSHPAKAAAVAAWWIILLHFPRGALEGYTRQLVWFAIVPYVIVSLVASRGRRLFLR